MSILTNLEVILLSSIEAAPWGWAMAFAVIVAIIKGWPALSDAAVRARSAMSAERQTKYERFEARIEALEHKYEQQSKNLHAAEMKLVSALTAYRLVIGELQKVDPDNAVLRQAQALLNVSYPAAQDDPVREMVRETHAATNIIKGGGNDD